MIWQGTSKNFVKTHEFGTNPLHTLVQVMEQGKSITHTSECNELFQKFNIN